MSWPSRLTDVVNGHNAPCADVSLCLEQEMGILNEQTRLARQRGDVMQMNYLSAEFSGMWKAAALLLGSDEARRMAARSIEAGRHYAGDP